MFTVKVCKPNYKLVVISNTTFNDRRNDQIPSTAVFSNEFAAKLVASSVYKTRNQQAMQEVYIILHGVPCKRKKGVKDEIIERIFNPEKGI